MAQSQVRNYTAQARSTDTFGRVMCTARHHHFIADGPVANGCPGVAINPGELFLAGIAACGVELLGVIAKEQQLAPKSIGVDISGTIDRGNPVRQDLSLFNTVRVQFEVAGVTQTQANDLVERWKGR